VTASPVANDRKPAFAATPWRERAEEALIPPLVALLVALICGDLLILTSQVGWVIYTLYSRATKTQLGPVTIMAGSHVVSCALLLPMALIVDGGFPLARAGWAGWGVVLYGAFPVTLGHLWYYKCIRSVGAGRAAVFSNLIPFLVIGLSWGILGEPIRWYHAVGATVVIAGVILTTRR